MIGPSSSHTAGAVRLGKIARIISGEDIKKVQFLLHGSFAKTYKGHGTDKALTAGILGMDPWDEKLNDAISIASTEGKELEFIETDLGDVHPNTVNFIITKQDGDIIRIQGSSIGGGNILITEVDGEKVEFTGEYPTLIIKHKDVPGMVSSITAILYENNINIAFLKVYRSSRGSEATMIFETDSIVTSSVIEKINVLSYIDKVIVINPVMEG
jgi:L-serine dehydratase